MKCAHHGGHHGGCVKQVSNRVALVPAIRCPLTVAVYAWLVLPGVVPACLVWPPPAVVSSINGTALSWPALQDTPPADAGLPTLPAPDQHGSSSNSASNKLRVTLAWSLPVMAVVCLFMGAACSLFMVRQQQDRVKKQERQRQQVRTKVCVCECECWCACAGTGWVGWVGLQRLPHSCAWLSVMMGKSATGCLSQNKL